MSLIVDKLLPITWADWEPDGPGGFTFYDVNLTADFGVYQKGYHAETAFVTYDSGYIETYNKDGNDGKRQYFMLTPINRNKSYEIVEVQE